MKKTNKAISYSFWNDIIVAFVIITVYEYGIKKLIGPVLTTWYYDLIAFVISALLLSWIYNSTMKKLKK